MPDPPREVGSEFHWDPAALLGPEHAARRSGGPDRLPQRHSLFATGCGALTALLRILAPAGRLHVPSYFCTGVAEALAADAPLVWYRHLPDGRGPRLETLEAAPGDIVLAQNLFGHDTRDPWDLWSAAHPAVTLVEDHSHDPFSRWARTSTAAYAMASLRKTLPLPDGGLLWSPRGLDLPEPAGGESPGAALKLAGMLLKAAWLDGRAVPKEEFRALQQAGECALLGSTGPASALTRATLPLLDVGRLRAASSRNARSLIAMLPEQASGWRFLPVPPDSTPFRVQVRCVSEEVRDALQAHLARQGIYAAVHWRQDRAGFYSGDDEAADLAARMLTVPVDHRCRAADVSRVAGALRGFDARAAGVAA